VCRPIRARHLARKPPNLHLRISDTLRRMAGMEHQIEAMAPPLGYFVDNSLPQRTLVREVKGRRGTHRGLRLAPVSRHRMKF
jgi:hypothetical protein